MRKIKFFKSVETELGALEEEINNWIEAAGGEIISITGNIAPQTHYDSARDAFSASDVLIIVTYEAEHA